MEEGGFLYDSDAYNDDLPYWNTEHGMAHLIIPYTLDVNDMRFATPQGFNSGDQFFTYLRDSLDFLLEVKNQCSGSGLAALKTRGAAAEDEIPTPQN